MPSDLTINSLMNKICEEERKRNKKKTTILLYKYCPNSDSIYQI